MGKPCKWMEWSLRIEAAKLMISYAGAVLLMEMLNVFQEVDSAHAGDLA